MTNIRAVLAADPELGAGNVVPKLLAHGADPDGPGLAFDTTVDGHPAWQPLTLGQVARMSATLEGPRSTIGT